jgi:hypothetical protein
MNEQKSAITWQPGPEANEEPIVICRAIPSGTALVPIEPDKDADVIALVQSARTICQYAESRVVANLEDTKLATEDLSTLSLTMRAVKEKQADYTKPYKTLLDGINGVFKPVIDSLDKATSITKSKLLAYRAEVERRRLAAEAINREKEELAKREAALNEGEITVDLTPVPVPEVAPKTVYTEVGNAGVVKNWHYRVTNFTLLDDVYKLENTVVLNSIARKIGKGTPPTIAGIEFYQEDSLRVTPYCSVVVDKHKRMVYTPYEGAQDVK